MTEFEEPLLDPLSISDDADLFERLLRDPALIDEGAVFWADGRILSGSDPARRTVIGWHRGGGPLVVGVTTDRATDAMLVEALRIAAEGPVTPSGVWVRALEDFWGAADPALAARVRERWGLPSGGERSPEAWADRAWGQPPAEGRVAIGLVAGAVPEGLRRAVGWLAEAGAELAAWEVRRVDGAVRAVRVAGRWNRSTARPMPAEEDGRRRAIYVRHTGAVTGELLARIEALAQAAGSRITWSGEDWVRIDGPGGSIRAFPSPAGVDLQLVGADEGTRVGLSYRHGVSLADAAPEGAAPGVHLRLTSLDALDAAVERLIGEWLGRSREANGGTGRPAGKPGGPAERLSSPDAPGRGLRGR
ncbi:MAG TPA: hypothetical protein VM778_12525 [Gemmatimonadota bacterium]|nr:hypothetical protein [Gemmatimonadota bacterium]